MDLLAPDRPTVLLFLDPEAAEQRSFADALRREVGRKAAWREMDLNDAIAREQGVETGPAAVVYDRRGRVTGRATEAGDVVALVEQAAMVFRLDYPMEGDPRRAEAERIIPDRRPLPYIIHALSSNSEYLEGIYPVSRRVLFTDGSLDTRQKEMIATYASALNRCNYCMSSHARNLKAKGQDEETVEQLATLSIRPGLLDEKHQTLMDYVQILTLEPASLRDTDTQRLRDVGWTDEQIYEASFVTALYAFYNRMAEAYGLDFPTGGYLPPSEREPE